MSSLEGGYRIQGSFLSPFARSVQAHVSELVHPTAATWTNEEHEAIQAYEGRQLTTKRARTLDRERVSQRQEEPSAEQATEPDSKKTKAE